MTTFGQWNISVNTPKIDATEYGVVSSMERQRYPVGLNPVLSVTHHIRFDGDGPCNDMVGTRDSIHLAGLRRYVAVEVGEIFVGAVTDGEYSSSSSSSSSSSQSFSSSSSSSSCSSSSSSSSSKYLNFEYELYVP